jgi:hypothetical protein
LAGNGSDLYDFTENHKPIAEARYRADHKGGFRSSARWR